MADVRKKLLELVGEEQDDGRENGVTFAKDTNVPDKIEDETRMNCKVCGHGFVPEKENRYEAFSQENLLAIRQLYDCFDCPKCGCQNVAGERMKRCEDNHELPNVKPDEKRN